MGLLADIEEMKRRMARLEGKDTIRKRDIALLKREYTIRKRDITLLKREYTISKTDIAQLKREETIIRTEIAQLKREDTINKTEIALLKMEDTIKGSRIEGLEHRLATVTSASEGYRKIRHRFLDVFVRDHMGGVTAEGRQHIREGNLVAHGADVLADAEPYSSKARQDENVFIESS